MNRFMKWLAESFAPTMNRWFSKPWLAAVSSCMQKIIPFILTGSLIYFYNVFVSFIPSLPDLSPILNYSFMLITMIVAFMMANQCMEKLNHPGYTTNAGVVAICILFMAVTPKGDSADSLSSFMGNLGPSGIAVGMVIGLLVSVVFHLWGKLHFLEDSSVPDFVTGWINTIIPNVVCLAIGMIVVFNFGINLVDVILGIFMPISNILSTLPGFVLYSFVMGFFYTLGVSTWLWGAISTPVFMINIQQNIDAVAAGNAATQIVTSEAVFTLAFITMGGVCCTLGLNLLMCFSKSKQLKMLGRVFLAPSIFNINEPIMFGAPVVFTPLLMLPAWINAIIGPIYVWILMSTGLLNIPSKMIQVGQIPAPFCSVMVTQDMRALLWWAVLFVIYIAIWYPFFKVYEKQKLQEESQQVA